MSSDIPRVVYQPSPSISRGNRKQYAPSGGGTGGRNNSQSRENDGSIGTITTKPEGESVVGRYYSNNNEGGEKKNHVDNNNENSSDDPLNQSRSFGASSRRLAARNQAKANYRASAATSSERSSSQPPPSSQRDEENDRQHDSFGQFKSHASQSHNQSMAKQPHYHQQQQQRQQQQPRPSYPVAGDRQPPQRQHMERPPQGQQHQHHHRPPPPIKSNSFQPGVSASSAPSTPQNHVVRTPLSPRSPNMSPGATSPRDYNVAVGNSIGNANGSISRMVNQTVASPPASVKKDQVQQMSASSPNLKAPSSNKGIAAIDPQSIQQSNTTFNHILTQLSNLNQSGRYLSAYDLLVQSTTPEQRCVLWPILKHKVETLPTFPEAGEDDGLCLLRESERVFGPSLRKLVEIGGKANVGNGSTPGPSLADGMLSPMSGAAGGDGFREERQQQPSDNLQQGQYEGQSQGRGQNEEYQDQGYQHGEEEYNNHQRQDYNDSTEQYYVERGYQPQQQEQNGNNGQGRRVADEREAFDYSRMDDSHKQRNPTRGGSRQQRHHEGRWQYVSPSFHETNASERGGGPDRFREHNGHQQWNGPSNNHERFDSSGGRGARPGHQEHSRSHQDGRHLSTHHDHDGGSHYTNYRVENGYQRQDNEDDMQQSVHNDAHSVHSRFSKASRSMFAQPFDDEYEVNANRRQKLFEEMEHTSRILRSTTNEDVRRSHMRHLKSLREEWEELKGLASPTKSTLETNDVRTNAERSTKSSAANTSSSSRRASRDKKIAKKLWRGEQILLRDPNDGHGGGIPDDKSIGLKSARSMATNARSIFDDDAKSVATAPASRPMGKRTVNVVAPETLPSGFAFEARLGDHVFMATVPEGGVAKGEVFASVINDIDEGADKASVRVRTLLDMGGPKSRWRDELLDCFTEGFFHPLICNSIFCPQVALTQIMARMQMTSVGERGITLNSRFKVNQTLWLTIGVVLVHILYAVPIVVRSPQNVTLYALSFLPLMAMDLGLLVYFWYLLVRTRKAMRDEYDIPQIHCKCGCGAEDACMAVFCSACTLAQMGRHTADYTTYRAMCCSDTGLPNHVEVKLPSDPMNEMV